jgi:CheY-like chemotaxis protein
MESAVTVADLGVRPSLLVAEDDTVIRQVLGRILKKLDYDHDFATDGLKAVEMWENGSYDLILMDVQMPHMDGFKVTAAIREKERMRGGHTIIVAMTAHSLKEDEERCLAAGMDAYLSKPIDLKQCLGLISELIKNRCEQA